jgi:predicted peroxiredoxin
MADILIISTRGVEDPTRAGLGFVLAKGAVEEGHHVSLALLGDATLLMKAALRESIMPVGLPPLKELFQFSVDHKVPVYV